MSFEVDGLGSKYEHDLRSRLAAAARGQPARPTRWIARVVALALIVAGGLGVLLMNQRSPGATFGWRLLESRLVPPRSQVAAVWTGSDLFVVGGVVHSDDCTGLPTEMCDGLRPPLAVLEAGFLDIDTGKLRPVSDAPVGFYGRSAAVVGDQFLASGLMADGTPVHLLYTPATDSWEELQLPDGGGGLFVDGSRLVNASPVVEKEGAESIWIRDVETTRWRALPPDPLGRSTNRSVVGIGDDDLLLLGMSLTGEPRLQFVEFDFDAWTWGGIHSGGSGLSTGWIHSEDKLVNPLRGCFPSNGDCISRGGIIDRSSLGWSELPGPPEPNASGTAGVGVSNMVELTSSRFDSAISILWLDDASWSTIEGPQNVGAMAQIFAAGDSIVVWDGFDREGGRADATGKLYIRLLDDVRHG